MLSSPSYTEVVATMDLFLHAGRVSVKRKKRTNTSSELCNMLNLLNYFVSVHFTAQNCSAVYFLISELMHAHRVVTL